MVYGLVSCGYIGTGSYLEEDLGGVVLEVNSLSVLLYINLELILEIRLFKVKLQHVHSCWLTEVETDFIH